MGDLIIRMWNLLSIKTVGYFFRGCTLSKRDSSYDRREGRVFSDPHDGVVI